MSAKKVVYIGWTNEIRAYDERGNKIKGRAIPIDENTKFVHHVTGYGEVKISRKEGIELMEKAR